MYCLGKHRVGLNTHIHTHTKFWQFRVNTIFGTLSRWIWLSILCFTYMTGNTDQKARSLALLMFWFACLSLLLLLLLTMGRFYITWCDLRCIPDSSSQNKQHSIMVPFDETDIQLVTTQNYTIKGKSSGSKPASQTEVIQHTYLNCGNIPTSFCDAKIIFILRLTRSE